MLRIDGQNLVERRGDKMTSGWRGWLVKTLWSGGVTEWQVSVGVLEIDGQNLAEETGDRMASRCWGC